MTDETVPPRAWQIITDENEPFITWRLRVPGGWIYAVYDKDVDADAIAHTTCFVPLAVEPEE